jgi:2-polyprenyl-3-methyl-5-hydroxy-6-metoxy-1,4-benzoquinol methylase
VSDAVTRESQYQRCVELRDTKGLTRFGLMSNQLWEDDPRHIVFLLSRYKFASKILSGRENVLEIGCADGFGSRVVLQEVKKLTAVDFDPVFVQDANDRMDPDWAFECKTHDMLAGPVPGQFDGAYCLDVIEHIQPSDEETFVRNVARSLTPEGVFLVGSPSIQSQAYASPPSREGHVNCKDAAGMKALMSRFFHNVFIFSMNDEVVHTGYYPMAHYLLALCCSKRDDV